MSFSRVPEEFLKGIFLAPHNFSDPENPQHGQFVNIQLRNDLYFSTLHEVPPTLTPDNNSRIRNPSE